MEWAEGDLPAGMQSVFCGPGCLTCEGQNQGLERRCWPEHVLREGVLPEEEPRKAGWFQSLCPHRSSPHSQALEVLVGCTAVGANAEQVAYPNINMFVCSIATWKDWSRFLWVDTAFQNFSSRADLCHQVSEHPLHVPSTSILLLAFSDQIDFPTFIIG